MCKISTASKINQSNCSIPDNHSEEESSCCLLESDARGEFETKPKTLIMLESVCMLKETERELISG